MPPHIPAQWPPPSKPTMNTPNKVNSNILILWHAAPDFG
ncbi:hypothetical protein MPQ_2472 [Methylovorus sp. MP688]|nr:hypothetical protein MPQ_2472 [Methylovorus sp. MP688]